MGRITKVGLSFLILIVLGGTAYTIPAIRERLDWRLAEIQAQIKYAISPPNEAVFIPQEQSKIEDTPTLSPTTLPSKTPTSIQSIKSSESPTFLPTSTPEPTRIPLPVNVNLPGVIHEYQTWNNCGPANLLMALSYWGWKGTQQEIAGFTKPNPRDKNVMPYELSAFVEEKTDLDVIVRVGGDIELIKTFLAQGFPVIMEKGFEGNGFDDWMGHYVTVTGYDDEKEEFTVQDSFIRPDMQVSYDQVELFWRAFNFTYLVIYPSEQKSEITAILGDQLEEENNYKSGLKITSNEIYSLSNKDLFFAWFNRGTNLVALKDYAGAAEAYDEAFGIYSDLIEDDRPWRMMWYQTGPYWAYFYTERYYDVINLATTTLDAMSEPVLEESYYWRALAKEAIGDWTGAVEDLQLSLEVHPGFEPSVYQLERMSINE